MPTIEQCRTYAAEYKILAKDQQISARRSTVLLGISRSWTALAHQLENLTAIAKEEESKAASVGGLFHANSSAPAWVNFTSHARATRASRARSPD
jgi:hypothetical protein